MNHDLSHSIGQLDFLNQSDTPVNTTTGYYKILVADDDKDIHQLTQLLLKDFDFEGNRLHLMHTYSAYETIECLKSTPDIAIVILDVVMESMNAGIQVIEFIRNTLRNKNIRILLRTGQPGYAPEDSIIRNYDINDYKLKTELTKQKLFTSIYTCLRSYRDLVEIERNKTALEELVKITSHLFRQKSLEEFLLSIFKQIKIFKTTEHMQCKAINGNGLIYKIENNILKPIVGSGAYSDIAYANESHTSLLEQLKSIPWASKNIHYLPSGIVFFNNGIPDLRDYVYIEVEPACYDDALIELLINNYALALENYQLNELLLKSHEDVIFALTETIERHSNETSNHVKRVSELMYLMASKYGITEPELGIVKMSSVMHDIGKIGIPDSILKKPARLTQEEYDVIKSHSEIGFRILNSNDHPIFIGAASIAFSHHERFDGTGYPRGLKGKEIPLYARMMAIIDVFDALVSKRCYKEAYPIDDVLEIMKKESFDPELLELFFENIESIKQIILDYRD